MAALDGAAMGALVWPTKRNWRLAASDMVHGLLAWEIWTLLGVSDIRQRYKRSRLGQFWITASMAFFIASTGVVYSLLFKQPIYDYVPLLAVNMTVWTLLSGIVTDSTTAFVQASMYLRQDALPKTIFVIRVLTRNLIILGHNILIIPLMFLIFGVVPTPVAILAIPGLALLIAAAFAVTLISSILCTRFRDLPQIVQNLLQVAFFVTPVLWRPEQIGESAFYLVALNPFAAFLRIVADPLRGQVPDALTYANALLSTIILFAIALPLFARFRARIVYWL
jgi:ABC-type polysaccharide/polyol phosphate export permease